MAWRIGLGLLALFLGGCGTSTHYTPKTSVEVAPKHGSTRAKVLLKNPETPYTEVGVIEGRRASEFSGAKLSDIVDTMQAEASERGCDALVMRGRGEVPFDHFWGGADEPTKAGGAYRGSCIVWHAAKPTQHSAQARSSKKTW